MSVINARAYNLSFTAAALRPDLAGIVARIYQKTKDWDLSKEMTLNTNALQCRTASSAVRLEREIRQRIQNLTPDQLHLLAMGTHESRAALAWLAVIKHSEFVRDFTVERLRSKMEVHDLVLHSSDYETFIEENGVLHPELASLSSSSAKKIRQVLLTMLRQASLLEKGPELGRIIRPLVPPEVRSVILADDPQWLAAFLTPNSEIPSR
jgi:hypothetical protein